MDIFFLSFFLFFFMDIFIYSSLYISKQSLIYLVI